MNAVTNPTPNKKPGDEPKKLDDLEDLSALMADLDSSDSLGLSDSAVGMILGCANETDSAIKAAQLEEEMRQSLAKLEKAAPDDLGAEPPSHRE